MKEHDIHDKRAGWNSNEGSLYSKHSYQSRLKALLMQREREQTNSAVVIEFIRPGV